MYYRETAVEKRPWRKNGGKRPLPPNRPKSCCGGNDMSADLATRYMGLTLRNPVVIGSSELTSDAQLIERCADAGAGAVVMKSFF